MKRTRWREHAKSRTDTLDFYLEKLTVEPKFREALMKPVKTCHDFKVSSKSEAFFHFITYDLPKELSRHLIEKSTKKGQAKKIAEAVAKDKETARVYTDRIKS